MLFKEENVSFASTPLLLCLISFFFLFYISWFAVIPCFEASYIRLLLSVFYSGIFTQYLIRLSLKWQIWPRQSHSTPLLSLWTRILRVCWSKKRLPSDSLSINSLQARAAPAIFDMSCTSHKPLVHTGLITAIVCAKPPPTPIILPLEWMGYFAYGKDFRDINCSQVFCGHDTLYMCMLCQGQGHGNVDKHRTFEKCFQSRPLTLAASFKKLRCFPNTASLE